MKMHWAYLLLFFSLLTFNCYALEDIRKGEFYECVKCLCHAVSGCWRRENCAKYSISKDYWLQAGSPRINETHDAKSDTAYAECLKDENCIVHTIKQYTDARIKDCNCDQKTDCKDRLAIHLGMGKDCINPYFGKLKATRFNHCAEKLGVKLMEIEEPECSEVDFE